MVIFGTIVGGLILFFISYLSDRDDILGYKFHKFIHTVSRGSGVIGIKETILKGFSQIVSLGFGGSVGQEGPMAQLGGSIGSIVGQRIRIKKSDLKIFIACGIAGAIAAAFNAPITGVLFVEEVALLRNIKIRSFLPVVISAATATVIAGFFRTEQDIFTRIDFLIFNYNELFIYALMGVAIGFASSFFTKLHFFIEKKFDDYVPNFKIRPIIGGVVLGLLAIIPFGIGLDVLGDGSDALRKAMTYEYSIWIAIGILLLKPIATSITLNSGWPGGIFAPSIFMGAICGYLFGFGVESIFYPQLIPGELTTSYSIVGMGTFLAAMTQAPLTAIFFTFELTQTYQAVLPVMISSVIGTSIYRLIIGRSFEACYLKNENLEIIQNEESNILSNMKVNEIMRKEVVTIPEKMTLGKFIEFLPSTHLTTFPLIDQDDNLSGIITVQDYRGWVLEEELRDVIVMKDLASTNVNTVTPDESMLEVLKHWDKGDMLPVVSRTGSKKIIGILARRDALIAYNKALSEESSEL
tara:strand:+ start:1935 stop:3503 length:1569 start_codon:yes stop_codon:yes gene_type:complete